MNVKDTLRHVLYLGRQFVYFPAQLFFAYIPGILEYRRMPEGQRQDLVPVYLCHLAVSVDHEFGFSQNRIDKKVIVISGNEHTRDTVPAETFVG
jgi:hypothetical protein